MAFLDYLNNAIQGGENALGIGGQPGTHGAVYNAIHTAINSAADSPASNRLSNFINSNRPVAAPLLPQVPQQYVQQHPFLGRAAQAGRFVGDIPISIGNTLLGQGVINPALDLGRIGGAALSGQPIPAYNTLKSAPARLGEQVGGLINPQARQQYGVNENAQNYLGNLAGTANPIATAYLLNQGSPLKPGMSWLQKANAVGIQGAKFGSTTGLLGALDANRNQPLGRQLLRGAAGGAEGGAAGYVGGFGASSAASGTSALLQGPPLNGSVRLPGGQTFDPNAPGGGLDNTAPQANLESYLNNQDFAGAKAYLDNLSPTEAKTQIDSLPPNVAKLITDAIPQGTLKGSADFSAPLGDQSSTPTPNTTDNATVPNPQDPYYNVNRYNVSSDAKQVMSASVQAIKPQIDQAVGTPLTNQDAIDLTAKSGQIMDNVVGKADTAQNIANNLALRQQIAQMAQTGKVDDTFFNLLLQDKAAKADIARQLQAYSIDASPAEKTTLQVMMDSILKTNDNTQAVLEAAKGVDFNNPTEAQAFYRQFVKPTAGDWVDALRYNSMLSSPTSAINKGFGDILNTGVVAPIEKTVTGTLDWLRSTATGTDQTRFAGEGPAYVGGYMKAFSDASANFYDTITGKASSNPMLDTADLNQIPLATDGPAGVVSTGLNLPTRLFHAINDFFSTLSEGGSTASLNYRAGQGVNVPDIPGQAASEATYRTYNQPLGDKGQGPVLGAMDYVPQMLQQMRQSDNPIASTFAKLTFPFLHIGANMLKQGVEYTPAGFATIPGAADAESQLSKALMGSATAIGAGLLASSGRLTWAKPTGNQGKAFDAAGIQQYSVKVGNNYLSYAKLGGLGFNFALMAAVKDSLDNKKLTQDQADTVLTTAGKWLNYYADMSFVKSTGDFVAMAKGTESATAHFLGNYVQQFIPERALLGWVTRIVDPIERGADPKASVIGKQLQQIYAQIPGLSQNVPAKVGPDGSPLPIQHPYLNAVSPLHVSTGNPALVSQYQDITSRATPTAIFQRVSQDPLWPTLSPDEQQQLVTNLRTGTLSEFNPKDNATIQLKQTAQNYLRAAPGAARDQIIRDAQAKGVLTQSNVANFDSYVHGGPDLSPVEQFVKTRQPADRLIYLQKQLSPLSASQRQTTIEDYAAKGIITPNLNYQLQQTLPAPGTPYTPAIPKSLTAPRLAISTSLRAPTIPGAKLTRSKVAGRGRVRQAPKLRVISAPTFRAAPIKTITAPAPHYAKLRLLKPPQAVALSGHAGSRRRARA